MEISRRLEAVSFATEPAHSTAVIGMAEIGTAAIGMVATGAAIGITITITLMISFSSGALAFPSSAIRMAMAIPMVTDTAMGPLTAGMGQVTTDMAPAITAAATTATAITATATTATGPMVTVTTAMVSIAAVITRAIAPPEIDQALPVSSGNYLVPDTIVVQSTE